MFVTIPRPKAHDDIYIKKIHIIIIEMVSAAYKQYEVPASPGRAVCLSAGAKVIYW